MQLENVLIVDQDPDDVQLLNEALVETMPEVHVEVAESCDSLLEKIVNQVPDVVFIDTYLPPEDGSRCLEELRKNASYENIIVVVLSGSYVPREVDYYLSKGADYFFHKPSSYSKLKDIVSTICSYKRA